ncbi:MAG: MBL fold metallo-hydrolase [Ignavibacteriales bacterium]|nr:MBL fold metallo-hydrolase [Ignavibacteriales bacterium]
MVIGPYTLHCIETGTFALDGGAMFGVVPWVFWSKTNPPDEKNRVTLAARCLLLIGGGRIVLIDTGNGAKFTDKQKEIFRLETLSSDLISSLRRHGVAPDDVTDVVLTHLHFDHAGGSTMLRDGRVVPTFPRARHYVQREHWLLSRQPTDRDRASFMNNDYAVLEQHGLLVLVDGEQEILPGIRVIVTNGHTASQQLPLISDGRKTLLYACDLIPFMSHLPYPYVMGFDVRPLITLEEKKRILPMAEEGGWILFLEHDPHVEAVVLRKIEKGIGVDRVVTLAEE